MSSIAHPESKSTSNAPSLLLRIDGKTRRVSLSSLKDEEVLDDLDERIGNAKKTADISLVGLLDWPHDVRSDALKFMASLDAPVKFYTGKGNRATEDLFVAALGLMVDTGDLKRFEHAKVAALEAACLLYPHALDGACDRIADRFKELGVKGVTRRDLLQSAREIAHDIDESDDDYCDDGGSPIVELFDDAPVAEDIVAPHGWTLTNEGIARRGESVTIPTPILIAARQRDANDETELVTLVWKKDGKWKSRLVDRVAIASTRTIVDELAPYGVIVTSNNAKNLVQYLADFETSNLTTLPASSVSRQLGWQGQNGVHGFLLGRLLVTSDTSFDSPTKEHSADQKVCFRGADEGDDQIADAFHTNGHIEKWLQTLEKVRHLPQVMLAIFASLAAPLLQVFRSPNFLISFAGRTSSGKTVTLHIGASCWGNPNEQDSASVLKTWSSTATWRERVPAILNNLPFFLDDTKHAINREDVAKTIYGVAQGVGKGRGTTKGVAKQNTWRTVALTSGEQPLTSFTEDGGTRSRVLSLWGSPFGKTDAQTGKLVREVDEQVKQHYGHAGPRLVQHVLANREQWDDWRGEYQVELSKFQDWAEDENNPFAGRMAPHFAAIATTAWIAHSALELPWDYSDPIEPLWDQIVREAAEANRGASALRYVMDWAYAHQQEFYGRVTEDAPVTFSGWAGRWDRQNSTSGTTKAKDEWKWIGFIPSRLKDLLRDGGYEPESTIRMWKDDGWLVIDKSSDGQTRCTKKVRVGREKSPIGLIAIKKSAIDTVGQE